MYKVIYLEFERCIGCRACLAACKTCGDEQRMPLNYVEEVNHHHTRQTVPMLCLQCKDPACVRVCPVDAIPLKDGQTGTADPSRCTGCRNCTFACPFGIPKFDFDREVMVKCDWCADRRKQGLTPKCAAVCPSDALRFLSFDEVMQLRRQRSAAMLLEGKKPVAGNKWSYTADQIVDLWNIQEKKESSHSD